MIYSLHHFVLTSLFTYAEISELCSQRQVLMLTSEELYKFPSLILMKEAIIRTNPSRNPPMDPHILRISNHE